MTKKTERAIFDEAMVYAEQVSARKVPQPMLVGSPKSFFNDEIDETKKTYFVAGGVCGFAWVVIKPAQGKFVKWLKEQGIGYKAYGGGWAIMAHPQNTKNSPLCQSLEINEAWARAFAEKLKENGVKASADSRMD